MELGSLVTDEACLWRFISGLNYQLRKEVLRERNLQTVSDAMLAAERADAVERMAKFGIKRELVRGAKNDDIVPMDIDNMRSGPSARGGRHGNSFANRGRGRGDAGPSRSNNRTSRDDGCFYCGKQGHWARDCYKKQRD